MAPGVAGVALTNKDLNYYRGVTVPAKVSTIVTDFAESPEFRSLLDGLYAALSTHQTAYGTFVSQMQTIARSILIEQVNADTPLATKDVPSALRVLIQQMGSATASVQASVPSAGAQTASGTPSGNAVIIASVKGTTGVNREYLYAETITFTCSNDSTQSTPATLGNEPLLVSTPVSVGDPLAYNWPGGSGVARTVNASDATKDASAGNHLTNSDFETWTTPASQPPDNWSVLVGTVATDIIRGASPYTGSYDLQLASGTASTTLSSIAQTFGGSPGTSKTLLPETVYAVNLACKVSAVPAAGVLEVSLIDGSNVIISDDAGAQNKLQITLSSETTSFATHNAFFRTPSVLPSTAKLNVRLSTALDTGKSVHVDHLCLTPATEVYTGGPFVAVFSMSGKLILNDKWTVAIGNTWGYFQQIFERWFAMKSLGLQLPSSGSPTINDNLIA